MFNNPMLKHLQTNQNQSQNQPNNKLDFLSGLKQQAPQIKQMWQQIQGSGGNVDQLVKQLSVNNPALSMLMGGNPEKTIQQLCQAQGIDMQQFLETIKGIIT